jgi:hypothetical protein
MAIIGILGARKAESLDLLLLAPFFLIAVLGAHLAVGHSLCSRRDRRRVRYCISSRRVLAYVGAPHSRLWEWSANDLKTIDLEREGGGLQTVVFGNRYDPHVTGAAWATISWPWSVPRLAPELVGLTPSAALDARAALKQAMDAVK